MCTTQKKYQNLLTEFKNADYIELDACSDIPKGLYFPIKVEVEPIITLPQGSY